MHVYLAWAVLDPSKTVKYVILPDIAQNQTGGNPDTSHGASVQDGGDGHTTATTAGGLPARTTTGSSSFYMYVNLDDGVVPGGTYQATAYVSYFDQCTGSWDIQYDSFADVSNSAYRDSVRVTDTNTDTCKTAQIPLPDAAFANRESTHSDLRLNIGVGTQAIGQVAFSVTGDNVVPIHLVPGPPSVPVVTQQPADATASATTDATFTAYAVGEPAPLVHWQLAGTTTSDPATLHVQ